MNKLHKLTDAEVAKAFEAEPEDLEMWTKHGCPQNNDGTWEYLTVLAWITRAIGEHWGGKRGR